MSSEQVITSQPMPAQEQDGSFCPIASVCETVKFPKGLAYLAFLDSLHIKQRTQPVDVALTSEARNKYDVFNKAGQQTFQAVEISDHGCRQCCGACRGFEIQVIDNFGKIVMTVVRPHRCCLLACCGIRCACSGCVQEEIKVFDKEENILGYVRSTCVCCKPEYDVYDSAKIPALKVHVPACTCSSCCADAVFNVYPLLGDHPEPVATISKQWSGLVKEMFTDADNFEVLFPMDLDVRFKATLFATAFLIDFNFFES